MASCGCRNGCAIFFTNSLPLRPRLLAASPGISDQLGAGPCWAGGVATFSPLRVFSTAAANGSSETGAGAGVGADGDGVGDDGGPAFRVCSTAAAKGSSSAITAHP